jgi:hypothetical protein
VNMIDVRKIAAGGHLEILGTLRYFVVTFGVRFHSPTLDGKSVASSRRPDWPSA